MSAKVNGRIVSRAVLVTTLSVFAAGSHADPVLDGILDAAEYGAPIAVQVNPTGFGDSNLGEQGFANGSEADAVYAKVAGGNLYLLFTGNMESNFNHHEVFFDIDGTVGQNTLLGNNADVDFNALNRMGRNLDGTNPTAPEVIGNGLTFDAGFTADFYIGSTGGNTGDGNYSFFLNYATLPTEGAGVGIPLGGGNGRSVTATSNGVEAAIDNSNVAGVTGDTVSNPEGVTTGVEYKIPLSAIGNPVGPIKISAFINGSGHDFLSNQFLAPLPAGATNPGEPRNFDMAAQAGDQFFTVTIPASLVGDTNDDGVVDLADLNNVLNNFGATGAGNPGDDNNDGTVDLADLNNVLNNFGNTAVAAGALSVVPEPATMSFVGLGAVGMLARRRRTAVGHAVRG